MAVQAQKNAKGEQDQLKALVERFEAYLAKTHEKAVQEYKANFKETNDYLDLMQDAIEEYKVLLKRVNPDFDVEHYDRLILELEEPQTAAPKDPVGFDQLDPNGTPRNLYLSSC